VTHSAKLTERNAICRLNRPTCAYRETFRSKCTNRQLRSLVIDWHVDNSAWFTNHYLPWSVKTTKLH